MNRWHLKFDLLFAGPAFALLVENGGRMETDALQKQLKSSLASVLNETDQLPYKKGGSNDPRWWTDVRSAAEDWRESGLIEESFESGHGCWRIKDLGKQSLAINRKDFEERGFILNLPGWILTDAGRQWWREERNRRRQRARTLPDDEEVII